MSETERARVLDAKPRLVALARNPSGRSARNGRPILMAAGVLLLGSILSVGLWSYHALRVQAMAAADDPRETVLNVRTAIVRANPGIMSVRLPAVTQAFAQA